MVGLVSRPRRAGLRRLLLDIAATYAAERQAFGKPIKALYAIQEAVEDGLSIGIGSSVNVARAAYKDAGRNSHEGGRDGQIGRVGGGYV